MDGAGEGGGVLDGIAALDGVLEGGGLIAEGDVFVGVCGG